MNRSIRVLLVDDDPDIRDFVIEALSLFGMEALVAADGLAALRLIEKTAPDVILLDMRMQGMDGWEFARTYRALPPPHAPIVVMSAATDVAALARQIGADAFLAKPFPLKTMIELVTRFAATMLNDAERC